MAESSSENNQIPLKDESYHKWPAFFAVAAGMFLTVAEQTAVALALPEIADDFKVDIPTVQWITLGYVLSTSAMVMPVGRLSDIVGRTKVYTLSLVAFICFAVVGGLAPVYGVLVVVKVVQGMAAAGVQCNAMAIVTDAFPRRERGRAIGLYTTTVGVGASAGPFLGGLLVNAFGWRSLFFASVPLGLIAILAAMAALRNESLKQDPAAQVARFDWVGAGVSSGALISLLLGLSNAHRFGWGSTPIVVSMVIAAGLFSFFVWWELRATHPMLDLTFFDNKMFSLGVATRFLLFLSSAPRVILMPFYLIEVLGYRPHIAGLIMVAGSVSMAMSGVISGRLSERFGARWLMLIGIAIAASAMFTFWRLDVDSSAVHAVVGLALSGVGMGTFYSPNTSEILGSHSRQTYGIVAALLNLTRTTGNVTGIAVSTTIVAVVMASSGYEPTLSAVADSTESGVKEAFMSGLTNTFLVSGSLLGLAFLLSVIQGKPSPTEAPAVTPRLDARQPGTPIGKR